MGYYSEVGIKCREKAFEMFREVWNEHNIHPDWVLIDKERNEYLIAWNCVKWYSEFQDVSAITEVMDNLDDMPDSDIEAEDGYGYTFTRIGEDTCDIESRTNNYEVELWVRRELDIDPGWKELDVQGGLHMDLIDVINEDTRLWERLNNQDKLMDSYLYLNECKNSKENGMYQLILNGTELWYGTLEEINAIVKSMCTRLEHNDFLGDD